ncbi:MAG: hypothetical protein DRI56_03605 [Chloroflexota bacterium]|nr:MAG: hypothetical protein DRI56_03605 [Chloroflexota bacterium]
MKVQALQGTGVIRDTLSNQIAGCSPLDRERQITLVALAEPSQGEIAKVSFTNSHAGDDVGLFVLFSLSWITPCLDGFIFDIISILLSDGFYSYF